MAKTISSMALSAVVFMSSHRLFQAVSCAMSSPENKDLMASHASPITCATSPTTSPRPVNMSLSLGSQLSAFSYSKYSAPAKRPTPSEMPAMVSMIGERETVSASTATDATPAATATLINTALTTSPCFLAQMANFSRPAVQSSMAGTIMVMIVRPTLSPMILFLASASSSSVA